MTDPEDENEEDDDDALWEVVPGGASAPDPAASDDDENGQVSIAQNPDPAAFGDESISNGQELSESKAESESGAASGQSLKSAASKVPDESASNDLLGLLSTVGDAGLREKTLPPPKKAKKKKKKTEKQENQENSGSKPSFAAEPAAAKERSSLYPDGLPSLPQRGKAGWRRHGQTAEFETASGQQPDSEQRSQLDPFRGRGRHRNRHAMLRRASSEQPALKAPEPAKKASFAGSSTKAFGLQSFAQRASAAGIEIDDELNSEILEQVELLLDDDERERSSLLEFARKFGLHGEDLNQYLTAIFYTADDKKLSFEALDGIKEEALRDSNPEALVLYQKLSALKAAIELYEAEQSVDTPRALQSLTQLALLEGASKLAGDTLDKHELRDEARRAALHQRDSAFLKADESYAFFLSRELEDLRLEQKKSKREAALRRIEAAGEMSLRSMGNRKLARLAARLRAINSILIMSETEDALIAAAELSKLVKFADQQNPLAESLLEELDESLASNEDGLSLSEIETALSSRTRRKTAALKALKLKLPDVTGQLNELRVQKIIESLSPYSSSSDFAEACKALDQERRCGNLLAAAELDWTRTGESTQKIAEALEVRSLADIQTVRAAAGAIREQLDRLHKLAEAGNEYARTTLVGMLMCICEAEQLEEWRIAQDKPVLLPDFSVLSASELSIISEHAAFSVRDLLQSASSLPPLQSLDARGMAAAFCQAHCNMDRNVQAAIEAVFQAAFNGPSKESAVEGLIQAESEKLPGSVRLAELILKAAELGLSQSQREQLSELAKQSTGGGIRALVSIAGGAIGYAEAEQASADLLVAAQGSENRREILWAILDEYRQKPDRALLLATLGKIAALDRPCSFLVLHVLRQALEKSAANADSSEFKSAWSGLLALLPFWSSLELSFFSRNFNAVMLEDLAANLDKMSEFMQKSLLADQAELLYSPVWQQRLLCLKLIALLSNCKAPPDLKEDLEFFLTESGKLDLRGSSMPDLILNEFCRDLEALLERLSFESEAQEYLHWQKEAESSIETDAFTAELPWQNAFGLIGSASLKTFFKLIAEKAAVFSEDLGVWNLRLLQLTHEFYDAEQVLEEEKFKYSSDEKLYQEIEEELSRQDEYFFELSAVERRLAVKARLGEKIAAMERLPESPLARLKIKADRLAQERKLLEGFLSNQLQARIAELERILRHVREELGWPLVQLELHDGAAAADHYQYGNCTFSISAQSLYEPWTVTLLERKLLQLYLYAMQDAAVADYSMFRSAGNSQKAAQFYEGLTSIVPLQDFVSDSYLLKRFLANWNEKQEERILAIAESIRRRSDSAYLEGRRQAQGSYEKIRFIQGRIHCLEKFSSRAAETLFAHMYFGSLENRFQSWLFPDGLPEQIQEYFDEWLEKRDRQLECDIPELAPALCRILENDLEKLQTEHLHLTEKASDIVEAEVAYLSSAGFIFKLLSDRNAGAASRIASAGIVPFEAVKELSQASEKSGDSLHVESPNWQTLRELYEAFLKESRLAVSELRVLLSMQPEMRARIEQLLLNRNISAAALSVLLKLEPRLIASIMGLPPRFLKQRVLALLESGIESQLLISLFQLKEPLRSRTFSILEILSRDGYLSRADLRNFLVLSEPLQEEFCRLALGTADSVALSSEQLALLLSLKLRRVGNQDLSDCLVMAKAMIAGKVGLAELRDFDKLDDEARSGLVALLSSNTLNNESCRSILDKLASGEFSSANVRELGMAGIFSKLPKGFVDRLLQQDPELREALFERLATQSPRSASRRETIPSMVERMEPLNELRKEGIINPPLMRLLSSPHASDLLLFPLLEAQRNLDPAQRLGPESLFQLAVQSRTNRLPVYRLESYRSAFQRASLDKQSLRKLLLQSSEQRAAAECLMTYSPELFDRLIAESDFEAMLELSRDFLSPARLVFPELYDEDGEAINLRLSENFYTATGRYGNKSEFLSLLVQGEFEPAVQSLEKSLSESVEDNRDYEPTRLKFFEKELALAELNHELPLQSLLIFIQAQSNADFWQAGLQNESLLNEPINVADPVILLAQEKAFRLRDTKSFRQDGQWRAASPEESQFIEAVKKSEAGQAVLKKLAVFLMEEWSLRRILAGASAPGADEWTPEDAEIRALDEFDEFSLRLLMPGNFDAISQGSSLIEFPNGMKAEISISARQFRKLENAFNQFLRVLKRISRLRGDNREAEMQKLLLFFEQKCVPVMQSCGVTVSIGNQSYLKLLYDITLESNYLAPGSYAGTKPIDLNLQQGLRRLLVEHPSGKQIYRELTAIKYSGITPKYDPSPVSGRPANINPSDQRELTVAQRSALATIIFSDSTAVMRGTFRLPEDCLSVPARADMSVLFAGNVEPSRAVFSRAEECCALMFALNGYKPLSSGAQFIAELYDKGRLNYLRCKRDNLIIKNDFVQILQELDIEPDPSLFENDSFYRKEMDDLLRNHKQELMRALEIKQAQEEAAVQAALRRAVGKAAELEQLHFAAGELISYNQEPYEVISFAPERMELFIRYTGESRDPSPAMARYLSDRELQESYRRVESGNPVHYCSLNPKYRTIYVLSTDKQGQKVLHNDWRLRCVDAEDVVKAESEQSVKAHYKSVSAEELCLLVRRLSAEFKEAALRTEGKIYLLRGRQILVGSSEEDDLQIAGADDAVVSGRHLQVLRSKNSFLLQDLNSSTGTYLNWRKLHPYESVALRNGDRVSLGDIDGPALKLVYKPKESELIECMVGDIKLLPGMSLTLGRLHSADVYISDPSVSKIQATVSMRSDGKVYLKDGGKQGPSHDGSMVNERLLIPGAEIELRPNDKIHTRSGIQLPIVLRRANILSRDNHGKSNGSGHDAGGGQENGKDRHSGIVVELNGIRLFVGVSPAHGVYGFSASRKHFEASLFLNPARALDASSWRSEDYRVGQMPPLAMAKLELKLAAQKSWKSPVLLEKRPASAAAVQQSRHFWQHSEIDEFLLDGFAAADSSAALDDNGNFYSQVRCATAVNRSEDKILAAVIADAQRRFSGLPPRQRSRALAEHARELLSARQLSPEQLDQWYDQFAYEQKGQRVLLGEFLKEGKGSALQQALLLKILADEFSDLSCKLVRGMNSTHYWVLFQVDGLDIIHDPRAFFISPLPGQDGALPQARYWQTEQIESAADEPDIRVDDRVSFDGTCLWKVLEVFSGLKEALIAADSVCSAGSAELSLLNPGQALVIGEKYWLEAHDSLDLDAEPLWTLESINKDGSMRFVIQNAIRTRVKLTQLLLRAQPADES